MVVALLTLFDRLAGWGDLFRERGGGAMRRERFFTKPQRKQERLPFTRARPFEAREILGIFWEFQSRNSNHDPEV
jgi:hypothetical protein